MKTKSKGKSKRKAEGGWWFILAAAGAMAAGAKCLSGPVPLWLWGLPLQALSAWLLWLGFAGLQPPAAEKMAKSPLPASRAAGKKKKDHSWVRWSSVFLAAALGQYFLFSGSLVPGLVFWVLSLLLLGLAKLKLSESGFHPLDRFDFTVLFLLIAVAALMRFPFVSQNLAGLQIDECDNISDSFSVLEGTFKSPYITGWGGNESLPFFLVAFFLKIFGTTVAAARSFSVLASLAALGAFYAWCRLFFSPKASLTAAFLLSVSWWFLFYSLSPFHNILVVLYEILAFYCLERAFRSGQKIFFALAGLFLGLSVLGYLPGRLVPVMAAAVILVSAWAEGKTLWKNRWPYIGLLFLVFLWVAGPFLFMIIDNPGEFFGRSKELSLFNEIQRTGNYFLLIQRFFWTLMSFFWPGDEFDNRFDLPGNTLLDPIAGLLFFLGLGWTLLYWRKRSSWQALSGFAFGMAANALAIQGPNPNPGYINPMRFFLIIPFLFFMIAQAVDGFSAAGWKKGARKRLGAVLLVLACLGSALWNGRVFYVRLHQSPDAWSSLGFNHIQAADFIKANYPRCHILIDWETDSSIVQVLTYHRIPYKVLPGDLTAPLPYRVDKNVMILFNPGLKGQDQISKIYPHAVWGQIKAPWGYPEAMTIEITKEDIEASQKGMSLTESLPD